jgi:hypothetical protein
MTKTPTPVPSTAVIMSLSNSFARLKLGLLSLRAFVNE